MKTSITTKMALAGLVKHATSLMAAGALFFAVFMLCSVTGRGQTQTQTFSSNGTWTCPAGVTEVNAKCYGGGGAGGKLSSTSGVRGGGGGGAFAEKDVTVVPGNSYSVVVGKGGDGSSTSASYIKGGDSYFGSSSNVMAKGGGGTTTGTGGTGGSSSSSYGSTRRSGGNGATVSSGNGGGGGGGAGTNSNGSNGSGYTGGSGGSTGGGKGGNGRTSSSGVGNPGSSYGGGGGGAYRTSSGTSNGGNGANGAVILEWETPDDPCDDITNITCGTSVSTSMSGYGVWDPSGCSGSSDGQEKVFKITLPNSGTHTLNVTSSSGSGMHFYIYSSCTQTQSYWDCIGTLSSTGSLDFTKNAGIYYLVLDPTGTGSYSRTFNIACAGPNPCSSVDEIECGESVTASLSGGGAWNPYCSGNGDGGEQVYKFVPPYDGDYIFDVTNSSTSGYVHYLYKSGSCSESSWTCMGELYSTGDFTVSLTGGTTYHFLVDAEDPGTYSRTFEIICPPPNPCDFITPIDCGDEVTATMSGDGLWNTSGCGGTSYGLEKVFSFYAPRTGTYAIDVTYYSGSTTVSYYTKSGSCSSSSWTCIDDLSGSGTIYFEVTSTGTKYLLLDAVGTYGPYTRKFKVICPQNPCTSTPTIYCESPVTVTMNDGGAWGLSDCYYSGADGQEKVYELYAVNTGNYNIQVSSYSGSGYVDYFVKQGSLCSEYSWDCIGRLYNTGNLTFHLTGGNYYQIMLAPETPGNYSRTIEIFCAPPCTPLSATISGGSAEACFNASPDPFYAVATGGDNALYTYVWYLNGVPAGYYSSFTAPPLTASADIYCVVSSCGQSFTTATQTVTIENNPPSFSMCPGNITVNNDAGTCAAVVNYDTPVGYDNGCPGFTVNMHYGYYSGSVFPIGSTTLTWKVTDAVGLTAYCTFDVVVVDNEGPAILDCPSGIVTDNDPGTCSATVSWTAPVTATDNCGGAVNWLAPSHSPGSIFPVGVTTVVYAVEDQLHNTGVCSFTVTVEDSDNPVINCPPVNAYIPLGLCEVAVYFSDPVGTDNCAGAITTPGLSNIASGTVLPFGTTVNTYTVVDASGNSAACNMTINANLLARTLNLKVFLEGLYAGGGLMNETMDYDQNSNYVMKWGMGIADVISVELHDAADYSIIVHTVNNIPLHTDGTAQVNIPPAYSGDYYVTVRHRSHIETTTAAAVNLSGCIMGYDFTTGASQAYGDNMKTIGGVPLIFSGDLTDEFNPYPLAPAQSGVVDLSDLSYIFDSYIHGDFGYQYPSDINGDGTVDLADIYSSFYNYAISIQAIVP